jgi:4-amino-4-deoxy-L-arabinose transferase-like glycosyltransferase
MPIEVRYRACVGASITRMRERARGLRRSDRHVLLLAVLTTLLLRLPFIGIPLGIDEGGYAYVATHWSQGSGGLYGAQWVDRPPLLIALYAAAMPLGGEVGVRLLGCLAAVLVVLACADVARRVAGSSAMRWSAMVSAVLASSTAFQSHSVNAELLAIACTAGTAWFVVRAVTAQSSRRAAGWALAGGVAGASAVLIKQSFVDGLLFAGVALAVLAVLERRRGGEATRSLLVLAAGAVGAVASFGAVVVWAEVWGPGVGPLLDALYGFRVAARDAIDAAPGTPNKRAIVFLTTAALSGVLALLAFVAIGLAQLIGGRRARTLARPELVRAVAAGLAAMGALGLVAIVFGGNWWRHYLIQLVPVLSIGTGLVLATSGPRASSRTARGLRGWTLVVAVMTVVFWTGTVAWSSMKGLYTGQTAAGAWLQEAASPGDTALVTWGNANVLERSGLATPYGLAWSLPVRVRDPHLREADELLRGPDAPTWIVEWIPFNSWRLDASGEFRRLVRARYERVSSICGKAVYRLRTGSGTSSGSWPKPPSRATCGQDAPMVFGIPIR